MNISYLKLGVFTVAGLLIFIATIYYLGTRNNIFENQIEVNAYFKNASGIQEGSNVRLAGIKIGVVDKVEIINDTSIHVTMLIDANDARFVKSDAKAWIGTEGLMGNKIINISEGSNQAGAVQQGDELSTKFNADLENIKSSVLNNSKNLEEITRNLLEITQNIQQGKGMAGNLLYDSLMQRRFSRIMVSLENTSQNAALLTDALNKVGKDLKNEKGMAGKLISDEDMATETEFMMDSLKLAIDRVSGIARELEKFSSKLNNDESTLHMLLTDTAVARDLETTVYNAKQRSKELEETIDIVNNSWVLNLFNKRNKNDPDSITSVK